MILIRSPGEGRDIFKVITTNVSEIGELVSTTTDRKGLWLVSKVASKTTDHKPRAD